MGKKDNRRTRKMKRLRGQRKKKDALAKKIQSALDAKGSKPASAPKVATKAPSKPKKSQV
jgi:hypothetical protein